MNNDKKDIIYTAEDIEKYFSGRLSPASMYEIERAALDDPFLAEAMEGYEGARDKNWKGTLAALRTQVAEAGSEAKVVPMHRSSGKWWKTAAAVLVIGAGAALTFVLTKNKQGEKPDQPIAQNVQTIPDPNTSTGKAPSSPVNEVEKTASSSPVKEKPGTVPETIAKINPGETRMDDKDLEQLKYKQGTKPVHDSLQDIVSAPTKVVPPPPAPATNPVVIAADDKILQDRNPAVTEKETVAKQTIPAGKRREQPLNNSFNAQVVAADNSPLPFSNISIKNENFGTYADVKGNFRLVSTDTVMAIEVRSIGYKPKTILLKSNQPVNKIVLAEDEVALNETIVQANDMANNQRSRRVIMLLDTVINVEPADGWDNYNTYVANNFEIPEGYEKKEIHGEVELSFDVTKNGSITNVRVDKSLGPAYDEAAKKLIEQGPQWKVKKGKKTSAKVKVKF
jgi:TonB family protein